jgi:hypothetical protein
MHKDLAPPAFVVFGGGAAVAAAVLLGSPPELQEHITPEFLRGDRLCVNQGVIGCELQEFFQW